MWCISILKGFFTKFHGIDVKTFFNLNFFEELEIMFRLEF